MRPISWILAGMLVGTSHAATITGTVTEAGSGLPIQNATVALSDADFGQAYPLDTATTDAMGNYSITFTVDVAMDISPAFGGTAITHGNIMLEVVAPTHAPQRFGDTLDEVDCFWFCELDENNLVSTIGVFPITDVGMEVRDFVLNPGAPVSGTVTDSSMNPLQGVRVHFYTPERFEQMSVFEPNSPGFMPVLSDMTGQYQTPIAFKPGTLYAAAGTGDHQFDPLPYGNFISQAYGGFDCEFLSCPISSTAPITVPSGSTPVAGIDFALNPGGELSGEIRDAVTGMGLVDPEYALVRIWTPDEGRAIATFFVGGLVNPMLGSNYLVEGLAGSYILEIDPFPSTGTNLLRILNDGTRCPFAGCDRANGVPITVTPGAPQVLNYSLERGGRIEGTVTDAATMMPVDGQFSIGVSIVDSTDRVAGGAVIDSSGAIITADGIAPGNYFVKTGLPFTAQSVSGQESLLASPYSDQLYMGVNCQGLACDLSDPSAVPVTISAGGVTTGVDFSLNVGHRISGTVTAAVSGDPLVDRNVEIYTTSGSRVALEFTDASGAFTTGGLPDGSYRVVVKDGGRVTLGNYGADGLGYFGQVYGNPADCMQQFCDSATGSDIVISGADVSGIDFSLNEGPTISGQVIDTVRGLPILLTVDVYDAGSAFVGAWSTIVSDDASYTTGALFPGTYTLIPRTTKTYSIGSPSTITRKGTLPPGTLQVSVVDADVSNATMGAFASLVFAGDFEAQ